MTKATEYIQKKKLTSFSIVNPSHLPPDLSMFPYTVGFILYPDHIVNITLDVIFSIFHLP